MPYLYESRQSVRVLVNRLCLYVERIKHLGVENIITLTPMTRRKCLPINSIEGLPVTYQMIKALENVPDSCARRRKL